MIAAGRADQSWGADGGGFESGPDMCVCGVYDGDDEIVIVVSAIDMMMWAWGVLVRAEGDEWRMWWEGYC